MKKAKRNQNFSSTTYKNKIYYDKKSDALWVLVKSGLEYHFKEVAPGVNVELDKRGFCYNCSMLNKDFIARIHDALKLEPKIIVAYVLGSYVSGRETKESDFDLAVVVENRKQTSETRVYNLVSKIKFPKDLDLSVVDKKSSPLFLFQAINGQCVYSRSIEDKTTLEAFVAENYYDTAHLRKIYYSYLKQKFPYVG